MQQSYNEDEYTLWNFKILVHYDVRSRLLHSYIRAHNYSDR